MIQLSFQPAFDPFHAVYRLLRLWPILKQFGPLHRDQVRILDFYLLFPFRADAIRLIPKHRKYKRLASDYSGTKPYGNQPDDRTVFDRMEPMQMAAMETLASRGLIDAEQLAVGRVEITDMPIPKEILERVESANRRDADLIELLGTLASDYDLSGQNGLKARTGLLEYRYDAV